MAKEKHGELKDIKVKEVSMVDLPANKLPFLFFKRDGTGETQFTKAKKKITIEIESDGTAKGTKISVNGDKLGEVRDFSFYFYGNDAQSPVSCSYSKVVESDDGFKRTETYYLSKGVLMTKEMLKTLQEYFGTDEIDFEKKADEDAVQEALAVITKEYKASFPEDLEKAVGIIAKRAASSFDVKENVEKAGAKFSKDAIKKLEAVIAAVEALKLIMSSSKESTQKADGSESEEMAALTKQLAELKNAIVKLGPEKEDDDKSGMAKLTKAVEKIVERVETMEKVTAKQKGLVDQDDDDDDNKPKGAGKDGKVLWKSIVEA